jgi:RNA polymerase sigma-54 factor
MSHALSQVARQVQQQQQRLTPQLIQAMDILQLNALALDSRIEQELDSNPALEAVPADDEVAGPIETPGESEIGERVLEVKEGGAQDFERLEALDREYDFFEDDGEYRGTRSRGAIAEEGDLRMEAMANAPSRPSSLREFLVGQWALVEVDDLTRRLGLQIIDSVTDSGRLEVSLETLYAGVDPPVTREQAEYALIRVQELEPPGVAARSLQECLLLQLQAQSGDTEIEQLIIEQHFDDLQRNRLPQIATALGVDVEDVKVAVHTIGRLSMHPGLDVGDRASPAVVPDVIVEQDAATGEYVVRLARSNQRELRISDEFREAIERSRHDKQAREFIKSKIDAASAIIDAVRFRRERLLEVAKAVVTAQRDFLDKGEQYIRVLRMNDLATEFGCDPSTISRTVDEKWVQTPRGIYPLRRFFTGGTESGSGEALGWDSIKAKVQQIVDQEDKSGPLSDDEIVVHLGRQGIEIKRRTVAKYRAQLDIPTARQRRRY